MKVVIWLKYSPEISIEKPMAGLARSSIEIARLLDGKADVSVYARGRGNEHITPSIPLYGIKCATELEYIRKSMKTLPKCDILHCVGHTYFYFFDEKPWKILLNLRGDTLPLFWSSIKGRLTGDLVYTRREKEFIGEHLPDIQRWSGKNFKGIDHIVACSQYVKDFSQRKFPGKQVDVIYNPISIRDLKQNTRTDCILFVGALSVGKGLDTLLETARILENRGITTPFYVVGSSGLWLGMDTDRYWRKEFQKRRNIVFLGSKSREGVLEYMREAKVGFIPSRTEGLSNVALEFHSSRTPIIASNVGGIPEAVINGKTGFLSDPEDPEQFAENIIHLLKNPDLRRKMGENGLNHVKKKFNPRTCAQKYLRVFKNMMK